ncbi:MAG TPA: SpoIID/LytB domain-containing protein, partial [bacterium]|nr:SpoIID/LytB domain-containing protein [bacterium]
MKNKTGILFFCAMLIGAHSAAAGEKNIRLLILNRHKPERLELFPAEHTRLFLGSSLVTGKIEIDNLSGMITIKNGTNTTKNRRSVSLASYGKGVWIFVKGSPKRLYQGNFEIKAEGRNLKIVNDLPLETYLVSVVSGEASDLSEKEALRAQAVAARTYTLTHLGRHKKDKSDLCDLTHCQLYAGFENVNEDVRWAVDSTKGEVLTYKGKLISSFYHSACGGKTESVVYVWPSRHEPYLTSVADGNAAHPYCASAPYFSWTSKIPLSKLQRAFMELGLLKPGEPIRKIKISELSPSGR